MVLEYLWNIIMLLFYGKIIFSMAIFNSYVFHIFQRGWNQQPDMVNHMGFINFINLVYDTYNYSIHGVYKLYKPIYNIWGPHIIPIQL